MPQPASKPRKSTNSGSMCCEVFPLLRLAEQVLPDARRSSTSSLHDMSTEASGANIVNAAELYLRSYLPAKVRNDCAICAKQRLRQTESGGRSTAFAFSACFLTLDLAFSYSLGLSSQYSSTASFSGFMNRLITASSLLKRLGRSQHSIAHSVILTVPFANT